MTAPLDCIPCFLRNALSMARSATSDPVVHEQIMREALSIASTWHQEDTAPLISQKIHRRLHELTGIRDPYAEVKRCCNRLALELLPEFRSRTASARDPLAYAVRLAIAGNVIDLAINDRLTEEDIRSALSQILAEPFSGDIDRFRTELSTARRVLYLTDNAGEIVFDRLLIEQFPVAHITVAVRGGPVLNDATLADAYVAGLEEIAEVIDTGSDVPGTILEECRPAFQGYYKRADVIVSKGQGNFETLRHARENICFLLRIKCLVVAAQTGLAIGTQALIHHRATAI